MGLLRRLRTPARRRVRAGTGVRILLPGAGLPPDLAGDMTDRAVALSRELTGWRELVDAGYDPVRGSLTLVIAGRPRPVVVATGNADIASQIVAMTRLEPSRVRVLAQGPCVGVVVAAGSWVYALAGHPALEQVGA